MPSMIEDLTKAGWIRVGPYSPYWKAPDDAGPSGRKWSERSAHAELTARASVKKVEAKPKSKTKRTRKPATPAPPPATDD